MHFSIEEEKRIRTRAHIVLIAQRRRRRRRKNSSAMIFCFYLICLFIAIDDKHSFQLVDSFSLFFPLSDHFCHLLDRQIFSHTHIFFSIAIRFSRCLDLFLKGNKTSRVNSQVNQFETVSWSLLRCHQTLRESVFRNMDFEKDRNGVYSLVVSWILDEFVGRYSV